MTKKQLAHRNRILRTFNIEKELERRKKEKP
jgi:hypothetical protein